MQMPPQRAAASPTGLPLPGGPAYMCWHSLSNSNSSNFYDKHSHLNVAHWSIWDLLGIPQVRAGGSVTWETNQEHLDRCCLLFHRTQIWAWDVIRENLAGRIPFSTQLFRPVTCLWRKRTNHKTISPENSLFMKELGIISTQVLCEEHWMLYLKALGKNQ